LATLMGTTPGLEPRDFQTATRRVARHGRPNTKCLQKTQAYMYLKIFVNFADSPERDNGADGNYTTSEIFRLQNSKPDRESCELFWLKARTENRFCYLEGGATDRTVF